MAFILTLSPSLPPIYTVARRVDILHMPSSGNTATWDFSPVYELLESLTDKDRAFQSDQSPTHFRPKPRPSDLEPDENDGGVGLGNFNSLWDYLGVARETPKPSVPTFESSLSSGKKADGYVSDSAAYYPGSGKNVKWRDETDGGELTEVQEVPADLTKNQRKKRNKKLRKAAGKDGADKVPAERTDNSGEESDELASTVDAPPAPSNSLLENTKPSINSNIVTRSQSPAAKGDIPSNSSAITHRSLLPHNIAPRMPTKGTLKHNSKTRDYSSDPHVIARAELQTRAAPSSPGQPPKLSMYDPSTRVSKALVAGPPSTSKKAVMEDDNIGAQHAQIQDAVRRVAEVESALSTPTKAAPRGGAIHASHVKPAAPPFISRQISEPPGRRQHGKRPKVPLQSIEELKYNLSRLIAINSTPPNQLSPYAQTGMSSVESDLPYPVLGGAQSTFKSENRHSHSTSTHLPSAASPGIMTNASRAQEIIPLTFRPRHQRNWDLLNKLMKQFPDDVESLTSPLQLTYNHPVPHGIHVFVDASNILIGFMAHLKKARGLHPQTRVTRVYPSFHALALLLERRRPVAKRVLAGSTPWVDAFDEAKMVGYDCSILDKVWKARELTQRQRRYAERDARRTSASDSNDEVSDSVPHAQQPKWVEQGVDEILHLKILESIVDTPAQQHALDTARAESRPGGKSAGAVVPGAPTMVLATGDAAEAEYSSGFRKMAERALKSGWRVEVMAWGASVSFDWKKMEKKKEYAGRFRIIELDDFAEELFGS